MIPRSASHAVPTLVLAALLMPAAANAARPYYFLDLGTPVGSTWFVPTAMNNSGQIVGYGYSAAIQGDAPMVWQNGAFQTLTGGAGQANDINDAGRIVGWSRNTQGTQVPAYWQGTSRTLVPTLGGGGIAMGVNSAGQIVGQSYTAQGNLHAFLSTGSQTTDLHSYVSGDGYYMSWATGINDAGQVAAGGRQTPAVSQSLRINTVSATKNYLPTLGGQQTNALAIDAGGNVVGNAVLANYSDRGFVWQGGPTLTEVPTLNGSGSSKAVAINDDGVVVGYADDSTKPSGQDRRAMMWSAGTMTDLNTFLPQGSTWTLVSAADINDAGQIVGQAQSRAFVMTPALLGDADGNGTVDLADLAALATNWNAAGTWEAGDFTGDGAVDLADLATLATNWNLTSPWASDAAGAAGASFGDAMAMVGLAAVPEPGTLALMGMGLAVAIRRRR